MLRHINDGSNCTSAKLYVISIDPGSPQFVLIALPVLVRFIFPGRDNVDNTEKTHITQSVDAGPGHDSVINGAGPCRADPSPGLLSAKARLLPRVHRP